MSHSSGLAGWDEPVAGNDLYDPDKVAALFETQEPWWNLNSSWIPCHICWQSYG